MTPQSPLAGMHRALRSRQGKRADATTRTAVCSSPASSGWWATHHCLERVALVLEGIFEPFVQIERGLSRTTDGTGLGLSISRDLARGMGGTLAAEGTIGAGSSFVLTLPRA
jgi:hypothetical protein